MHSALTLAAATLLAAVSLRAQIVHDGGNVILISGTSFTNFYPGDVIVGTNGAFTLLTISENALLTNSGNGIIGLNATAHDNEVRVAASTARWLIGTNLFVGWSNGSFNRLTINFGGFVANQSSFIGNGTLAGGNAVVATGAGSLWTNSGVIDLGLYGIGNWLVVSNGARASSQSAVLGYASPFVSSFPAGSSNTAVVTDPGSAWNNQSSLTIGSGGANCRLVISNAAFVDDSTAAIGGADSSSESSSNCEAVVTGAGSVWSNRTSLTVGAFANGARLVVTNGGAVLTGGDVTLGGFVNSTNNRIEVDCGTLQATNAAGNATLALFNGTNQFNGGVIEADRLRMDSAPGLFEFNAGLLTTRGAYVSNNAPFVVGGPGATPAGWNVLAGLTNHFLANDLYIGSNSSFNQLVITNGAFLTDNNGILGQRPGANSNLAMVAGMNCVWSNRSDLTVGNLGAGNQLIVSNGGWVANRFGYVARSAASSNNFALVSGSGSVWSNLFDLTVGFGGRSNRLVIEAGGLVNCDNGYISDLGGSNNEALVTGAGSVWSNRTRLVVGLNGTVANRLTVSNGAVVFSGSGTGGVGASNNQVIVTGPGSLWTNQSDFTIGGVGTRLYANNGGWVANVNCFMGSSGTVALSDSGSGWNNSGSLQIGYFGDGNTLIASNGATVLSSNALIGASTSLGNNNFALLTGAGTLWSNRLDLTVGNFGFGNRLVLSNGARLESIVAEIGMDASSSSNEVWVTGAGSFLRIPNLLRVGLAGYANRLVISNGASVYQDGGWVGHQTSSTNNEVIVTGAGSGWTNGNLIVGVLGSQNRLLVTNGGVASATVAIYLGQETLSVRNRAVTDGGALLATNAGGTARLDVRGGTNVLNAGLIEVDQLTLTNSQGFFEFNGGRLITRGALITNVVPFVVGTIGSTPAVWDVRAGANNHVLTTAVSVGQFSSFNQLLVTNGALLSSQGGFMSLNPNASSNTVVVAGPGSTWSNSLTFEIGSGGPFNSVVVSNSGFVSDNFGYLGNLGGNNLALVTGTGSVWSNASELYAGSGSASNLLLVSSGGAVKDNFGYVGGGISSSNNLALVTGLGSMWSNASGMYIGQSGAANRLVVSNGGFVWGSSAEIGLNTSSSNNVALVTGSGSVWSNLSLNLGGSAPGNQLIVTNGGVVRGLSTSLGSDVAGSSNNVALVTDAGSALSSDLYVGFNGARNQLVISNAAIAQSSYGYVGFNASGSNNLALVTGSGSVWSNAVEFTVGLSGRANQLVVSNGAAHFSGLGLIGRNTNANQNSALVTDAGTRWLLSSNFYVGSNGALNLLVVTNGAWLENESAVIGQNNSSFSNEVVITGAGSIWSNRSSLFVGGSGSGNLLLVTNGAKIVAGVIVGNDATSTNNRVVVDGGTLRAQNTGGTAFEVRRGTAVLNAGLIDAGQLLLTNVGGSLQFNGGTLSVSNSRVSNGTLFQIGNGVSPATLVLAGNGIHIFTAILAVTVSSNATLIGNGTIGGTTPLQLNPGSLLAPGTSVGTIILSNSPFLKGTIAMEISKTGTTLTNDQIQVTAPLTYGGSLVVSNIGPSAPDVGDRFPLFSATSFAGGFTNIVLPPLTPGLGWTNKLLVDGSIEVIAGPKFTSIILSGTNVIISGTNGTAGSNYAVLTTTNVTQPLSTWVSLLTNQFGAGGGFAFTNPIAPGELQRFFRIRTP